MAGATHTPLLREVKRKNAEAGHGLVDKLLDKAASGLRLLVKFVQLNARLNAGAMPRCVRWGRALPAHPGFQPVLE